MLRQERRAGTELGLEAERQTSQGRLLPDEIIVDLVSAWLKEGDDQFVFDGFPRSTGQANALEELLAKRETPLDVVIALDADLNTLQSRVVHRLMCKDCGEILSIGLHVASESDPCPKCGGILVRRSDDSLETLAARMVEYRDKTEPLLEYYDNRKLLRRVDSSQLPEVVFASVSRILEEE
jgi:adenylate kinase